MRLASGPKRIRQYRHVLSRPFSKPWVEGFKTNMNVQRSSCRLFRRKFHM